MFRFQGYRVYWFLGLEGAKTRGRLEVFEASGRLPGRRWPELFATERGRISEAVEGSEGERRKDVLAGVLVAWIDCPLSDGKIAESKRHRNVIREIMFTIQ